MHPLLLVLALQATQLPAHTNARPDPFLGVIRTQLAGHALSAAPGFTFDRTFVEGGPLQVSVDPIEHPSIQGANGYLFVVQHKTLEQWINDRTLVDARGVAQTVWFPGNDLAGNATDVLFGPVSGDAGDSFGVGYDLVIDLNWNNVLDDGDLIDGLQAQPGLWVVAPPQLPGQHAVTEVLYSGGAWLGQDLYYPSDIANLGQLPVVVVSHGNGHNYTWYDHIGYHLASWGCIVMSHQNNTGPGPDSASLTTLTNTDYLLGNLATIAGGALQGHVDSHRIVWIGHSRGGEGVARAYDRLFDGTAPLPVNFGIGDIKLVSSIAPTDFLGPASAFPHAVPYHLWVGGADSDVTGCADCDICQSFHLFGRAQGVRHSISLHGVGHGDFHDGGGDEWHAGPCWVGRPDTHVLMKTELVPLVKWYTEGTQASTDFFWRQWESFQPPGEPNSPCVVVDREYIEGPESGKRVIDDYQTNTATNLSSSGGGVSADVDNLIENRLDDPNSGFSYAAGEQMNGMTHASGADNNPGTRGCSFGWSNADRSYALEILPALGDLSDFRHVSFRACQMTHDVNTIPVLGDLAFGLALTDAQGRTAEINISAYGGGLEEPYQRTGCGTGPGWANEFETIRIPLEDFRRVERALDLSRLRSVEFRVGPSHGDALGRIGLDDVEFTRD
ncbi:MAG: hypothetical protein IPJ19_02905 [Planctomycetes bacterium]|nr:hypothetical protein [Planctomycetota bacterium]